MPPPRRLSKHQLLGAPLWRRGQFLIVPQQCFPFLRRPLDDLGLHLTAAVFVEDQRLYDGSIRALGPQNGFVLLRAVGVAVLRFA